MGDVGESAENDVPSTPYERETSEAIGNTSLHAVDHRNRMATFGIFVGGPECRGIGYGTETARVMLDYAFTFLGLHNVMLTVSEFDVAGIVSFEVLAWPLFGVWNHSETIRDLGPAASPS